MANKQVISGQGNMAVIDSDYSVGSAMQDADIFCVNTAPITITLDVANQAGITFNVVNRSAFSVTVVSGAGEPFVAAGPLPNLTVAAGTDAKIVYDTNERAWRVTHAIGNGGGGGSYEPGAGIDITGATISNTGILSLTAGNNISLSGVGGNLTVAVAGSPTLSGENFSAVPNAALTNSSVTIGLTTISLGATAASITGLTAVSATTFTGALTGNATTASTFQTARTINGVSFNGSANITVADDTKEPVINAGTTAQYYRGDKSWQTLDKTAVGLANVDNTSDANKPLSNADTAALLLKANAASPSITGYVTDTDGGYVSNSTSANAAARNFAAGQMSAFGKYDILISTTLGGSAIAGTSIASFSTAQATVPGAFSAGGSISATSGNFTGLITRTSAAAAPNQIYAATGSTTAHTYGSMGNTGALLLTGIESSSGSALFSGGLAYAGAVGTASNTAMQFGTNGAIRMTIGGGGNILIGTTTDNGADKLQVSGSSSFSSNITVGTVAAAAAININGINSGTGGGSKLATQVAGTFVSALGNYSSINGGAYDATPTLYANGNLLFSRAGVTVGQQFSSGGRWVFGLSPIDNGVDTIQANGPIGATSLNLRSASSAYIECAGGGNIAGTSSMLYGQDLASTGYVWNRANAAIAFATNGVEAMRITAAGYLVAGAITNVGYGAVHRISRNSAQGSFILAVDGTVNYSALFSAVSGAGGNAAATAALMGFNTVTGRTINAGGTINASGADYAEYMVKSYGCGEVVKGQIIGVDSNGTLTDDWASSVSFMVKTTNPSYVGGDSWGAGLDGDALEVARSKVDRIAFAGQVPVNVMNAKPGQLIIPTKNGKGIKGLAIDRAIATFSQYMSAVGIVQNILPDGRANIRVKVV